MAVGLSSLLHSEVLTPREIQSLAWIAAEPGHLVLEWSLVREARRSQGELVTRGLSGVARDPLNRQLAGLGPSWGGVAGKGILGSGNGIRQRP